MIATTDDAHNVVVNEYGLYVPYEPYSPSELSAMTYHGILRPQFGPYYAHVAVADTPAQRAKSVKLAGEQLIKGDWTASMLTAAWIHLGGQTPEMLEAGTASYQKSKTRSRLVPMAFRHMDYLAREEVADNDLLVIGGVVVTNLELTVEDLLRIGGSKRHRQRALELAAHTDLSHLQHRFERHGHLPGMDHARDSLEQIATDLKAR